MKKLILSLFIALFMASGAIAAANLRDADKAHEKGDYLEVIKVLTPLAIKGVPEAQFKLAVMYENGRGVKQDFEERVFIGERPPILDKVHQNKTKYIKFIFTFFIVLFY